MKIYKAKYGWSTSAHSKDMNGNDIKCFLDTQFKKGTEPIMESIEGDLIFREKDGTEWTAFFSSYLKQGQSVPKMVLMPAGSRPREIHKGEQQPLTGADNKDIFHRQVQQQPQDVVITEDELPFF